MLELLVAMSVTVILLGMVTFMTGVSMDGYKGSRDKVLGGRQAKEALEAITQDFEAMVARADGSDNMWLYAGLEQFLDSQKQVVVGLKGPAGKEITNTCQLIFFTSAPDRYDGDIGGTNDNGGDVSAVGYRLVYRDQISNLNPGDDNSHPVFTLYRRIVDPDETFSGKRKSNGEYEPTRALLGVEDLNTVWLDGNYNTDPPAYVTEDLDAQNVLAENIYELTVTFLVQRANGVKRFTIGGNTGVEQYHSLVIRGNGIASKADSGSAEVAEEGQLIGVEVGMTVLSDRGLVMTQKGGMTRGDIINEYGTHYTDTISVPRF